MDRTSALDIVRRQSGANLIAGEWVSTTGEFAVLDKFTALPVSTASEADAAQVGAAISALEAYTQSASPAPAQRAVILRRCADLIETHRADFTALMMIEAGFTAPDASLEIDRAITTLHLCAEEATRISGEMVPFGATNGAERRMGFTLRMPVGIVCAITPFNSPLNVVLHKVAPALAAGNAVVLKPSPHTPLTATLLVQVLLEAGVSPQSLALVHGGAEVGRALIEDPRVAFYAFTGSTSVGLEISRGAGIRRTQLELGSIASTIVAGTADLDKAVPQIANAAFRKAGQVCTSTQAVYVAQERMAEFTDRLVAETARFRAGDPTESGVIVGPLVSTESADRVESWVSEAVAAGAQRLTGDRVSSTVIEPSVLVDVPPTAMVRECEVFGPVVTVVPVGDLDEAFTLANQTPFGLSCGVFTDSVADARRAMQQLRFGAVHINTTSSARSDEMPFGGVKGSGHGHEGPRYAIAEMTEERLITFN